MEMPVKNIVSEIDLKPSDVLLPLFEAVVNSIHSLKLTKELKQEDKKIQVQVERNDFTNDLFSALGNKTINSFKVIDNGEGFNDSNYNSFKTAYSRKNKELGCKGVGRFTILAGYDKVLISSTFKEGNQWKHREIQFDTEDEVKLLKEELSAKKTRKTIVELVNAKEVIRNLIALSIEEIAHAVMEHCLVYYLCNDLPIIEILDKDNSEETVVNELYQTLSKDREKSFLVREHQFHCYITKSPKTNNRKNHYIHYCANSRLVGGGKSIARVNNLFAYPIIENGVGYFLDIYVVSEYLNKKVYSARNGFSIPQNNENSLFSSDELTFDEIEFVLSKELEVEYDSYVKETQDRNIKEVRNYIASKAPRYKRYLSRPDILSSIPPNLSDDKKEEYLFKVSHNERKTIDTKIQKFIEQKEVSDESIETVKHELKEKAIYDTDCLADYLFRRKAVIEIFNKFLEADKEGKYKLEEDIHNLIFPMGLTLDKIDYDSHNLWLLDERFATYSFIDSDKPITSYSQKKSNKEADLVMVDQGHTDLFDKRISFSPEASGEVSSMVIFEFKRPGETAHQKNKKDMRWEFSELVEKYFDEFLYADDKKNYRGRHVVVLKDTPKFGYVIVDVIPQRLRDYNLTKGYKPTPFGTLYKINPDLNLHLEVITFEQLIRAVEKRHAPFFDKLFSNSVKQSNQSITIMQEAV
ncbi:MAG: hypothetical protein ACTHMD_10945 [Flavisolibacter sp.]